MITTEQLTEWQRLATAATDGPWCYYGGDLWRGTAEALAAYDADPENAPDPFDEEPYPDNLAHIFHGDPIYPRDAEFIAGAREAVPALLDEVAALRSQLAAVHAWCEIQDALSKGPSPTTIAVRAAAEPPERPGHPTPRKGDRDNPHHGDCTGTRCPDCDCCMHCASVDGQCPDCLGRCSDCDCQCAARGTTR